MKKIFKFFGIFLLGLILLAVGFYFMANEPLPKGEVGAKADQLASKILEAIHHETYNKTQILEWSFLNKNHYKWYKEQNIVEVSWDNKKVILNTKAHNQSDVFVDNKKVNEPDLIKKAVSNFNNDSFWLVAPHKIFDNGTTRSIVEHNGTEALLVTYNSGGTTPGDSYLWIVNENGMPTHFKMWVSIIPIGGIEASWDQWANTTAGIPLPTEHSIFGLTIDMGDVKAYNQ